MSMRPNSLALCRECQSVVAANGTEGHTNWHVKLASAIIMAAGKTDPEYIEMVETATRLGMAGKYSVVW